MLFSFDGVCDLGYGVVLTPPSPAASGLTFTLASGMGANFRATPPYLLIIWPAGPFAGTWSTAEFVLVDTVVGDVVTLSARTQIGTAARTIVAGDQVAAVFTSRAMQQLIDAINAFAPGTGDVTGTPPTVADNFASYTDTTGLLIKDSGKKASDFDVAGAAAAAQAASLPLHNTADAAAVLSPGRTIDGVSFTGSANITVIAPATHAATAKATPVDADELPLTDSAASFVLKKLTWANLKATAKTYFDGIYTTAAAALAAALGGGTLTGNFTFGENTALKLVSGLSADGKYCGIVEAGVAGKAFDFGQLAYLAVADGRWEDTDADAEATAGPVKIGIILSTVAADGDPVLVLLWGTVRADAQFPTFTKSAPVYISTSPSYVTQTQPSGTDDIIRVIGFGNDANELFFCPSNDYMTHV